MRNTELDLMTLYGYAARNHSDAREVWRDFLSYLLPVLFQLDAQEMENFFEAAMTQDVDAVLKGESKDVGSILREISGELAHALELDREFGIAAFLEGDFPAKIFPLRRKQVKIDERETSKWVMQFSRIQKDPEIEQKLAELKLKLESALETDEEFQESA